VAETGFGTDWLGVGCENRFAPKVGVGTNFFAVGVLIGRWWEGVTATLSDLPRGCPFKGWPQIVGEEKVEDPPLRRRN